MLYTIAAVLLVLWLLGLVSSYTMGGLIHILLVVATGDGAGQLHLRAQAGELSGCQAKKIN